MDTTATPFSVLGPHPINTDQQHRIGVAYPRLSAPGSLGPGPASAEKSLSPCNKLHPNGLYTGGTANPSRSLSLRNRRLARRNLTVIDDPYRFPPIITEFDLYLHGEGTLYEAWQTFGAHLATVDGVTGVRFAVWAPNAEAVSGHGRFQRLGHHAVIPCARRNAGIWEIFIPGAKEGDSYKYFVRSRYLGHQQLKADPYGFRSEVPPEIRLDRLRLSTLRTGTTRNG